MAQRIVLFGDPEGVQQVTKSVLHEAIVAIVGATIRPEQRDALEKLAARHEVRFLVQPKRNSPEYPGFVDGVRALVPDLILVNSYSMRLGAELLDLPRLGCVNVHGGLLPEYRGSNPIQWALLNDEVETGVTMHYMTEGFDQGDIIARERVAICFEDTWLDVRERLQRAAERLLEQELPKILSGTNARLPQDESRARYYRRRSAEDGQVDWHRPVRDLYNLIRALVKPHPGAYYELRSQRVILDRYLSIGEVTALKYGEPGRQILRGADVMLLPAESLSVETRCGGKRSKVRVEFSIRSCLTDEVLGRCELSRIDFGKSVGEMRILPGKGVVAEGLCYSAVDPLAEFAANDLRLERLMYRVEQDDELLLESLAQAGFVRGDISEVGKTARADRALMTWRRRKI